MLQVQHLLCLCLKVHGKRKRKRKDVRNNQKKNSRSHSWCLFNTMVDWITDPNIFFPLGTHTILQMWSYQLNVPVLGLVTRNALSKGIWVRKGVSVFYPYVLLMKNHILPTVLSHLLPILQKPVLGNYHYPFSLGSRWNRENLSPTLTVESPLPQRDKQLQSHPTSSQPAHR